MRTGEKQRQCLACKWWQTSVRSTSVCMQLALWCVALTLCDSALIHMQLEWCAYEGGDIDLQVQHSICLQPSTHFQPLRMLFPALALSARRTIIPIAVSSGNVGRHALTLAVYA